VATITLPPPRGKAPAALVASGTVVGMKGERRTRRSRGRDELKAPDREGVFTPNCVSVAPTPRTRNVR